MAELSRRRLLGGGAAVLGVAGIGAAGIGTGLGYAATREPEPTGGRTVAFHGVHQAGIDTEPQAFAAFVALDLRPGLDRRALVGIMKVWAEDGRRLTEGSPALGDTEPELAHDPARLTVTVGFGPAVFDAAGLAAQRPEWLRPLPAFSIDRLEERWSGGDLLVQVCADDPVTVSHATRTLAKSVRSLATVRWVQRGFRNAAGTKPAGTTMRNLMGQVDGTVNPAAGSTDFDRQVWNPGTPAWLAGGTSVVVRRIRMELDTWDELDRPARELAVGRDLASGAPLTGNREHDDPDFAATDVHGIPVIPPESHVARARPRNANERFLRRGYNYDDPDGAGLLFASYQADVDAQFVPVQQRLAEHDALNPWITPIGSAVFAVPPGFGPGGYPGDTLLEG
ncbi:MULTISPECIES: Dyp-type peroxidase [Rhodococcus]|uniref:Dyp-type peroxidase n=2 Tax=Rhodococcus TaxID=1827 RepID=N1M0Q7_9NOCA|nr:MULTISPECIES: Dyp-type peroxidase [Rhodococcus]ETT26585.1 Dyp-type peroxidase family [Rhodococcus rhodochrous ATCC 21198]AKE87902.1 peroxidase [Rhodococcus aetherivorans]MDV6293317.1 Dyp-type peroxidase [Rhodococcus aetherivorans]NGP25213.1 Dyp-type peroxidase [Rhodococcus aetherivorans]OLL19901.1 peroxidase [Rhodococcus sp. M8]